MKDVLRFLLFPFAVINGGDFYAEVGTWKFRFLNWLYEGDYEETHDGWIYPE